MNIFVNNVEEAKRIKIVGQDGKIIDLHSLISNFSDLLDGHSEHDIAAQTGLSKEAVADIFATRSIVSHLWDLNRHVEPSNDM